MAALRTKSVHLTGYLEYLLQTAFPATTAFKIITPGDPKQRGAQLSLLFREGLMLPVFGKLDEEGVIVDERKPDVIRVAPLPMYNTFEDCWRFVDALKRALREVEKEGVKEVEKAVELEVRQNGATSP
jgi:kynureninase